LKEIRKFSLILLFIPFVVFSQEITVKGIVIKSTNFNNSIQIIKNDTIEKYRNQIDILHSDFSKKQEVLSQLLKNKYYVTYADNHNSFEIKAKLTDSLFFKSHDHSTKSYLVSDLIKKKEIFIKLELEPCVKWPSCNKKASEIYVFIGKKIKTWGVPSGHCNSDFNSRIDAKYLILENIYGKFPKDTIEFSSYSHEVTIYKKFHDYEEVLLYVLKYCDNNEKVKYLYDEVYKTKNGKWATPLNYQRHLSKIDSTHYIKPKKIDFINQIIPNYKKQHDKGIKKSFPELYNKTFNGETSIIYGYYPHDLFKIRQKNWLEEYKYLIK